MKNWWREMLQPRPMTPTEATVMSLGFCALGAIALFGGIFSDADLPTRWGAAALGVGALTSGLLTFRFWPRRGPR